MISLYFLKHIERQIVRLETHRASLDVQITSLKQFLRAQKGHPSALTASTRVSPASQRTPRGIAQVKILAHMKSVGAVGSRATAIALGLPFGTVSARLSKMRQEGLVKRESNGKWRIDYSHGKAPDA